jgi:iron(III) transport system substrate-binding protein
MTIRQTTSALLLVLCVTIIAGCGGSSEKNGQASKEVVLFTSLDPIFSEQIAREFEKKTGIKVKMQNDSEAAKTVGLTNRLIMRKEHPECDVFWNSELGQTMVLQQNGVIEPYVPATAGDIPANFKDAAGNWTGFAARARVILYNTTLVKPEDAPKTLEDLLQPKFKDQAVWARPIYGTTFTHAAALFSKWGPGKAKAYFKALKENGTAVAAGNAMARNLVVSGEKAICVTDTDDAYGALLKNAPVKMVYPDQDSMGTMVIPNSVCLIKGGPNPIAAKQLIDFLASAEIEALLAKSESAQMPVREKVDSPLPQFRLKNVKVMEVDWNDLVQRYPEVKTFIEQELQW